MWLSQCPLPDVDATGRIVSSVFGKRIVPFEDPEAPSSCAGVTVCPLLVYRLPSEERGKLRACT